MKLIIIYGPPASGKLTVAKELSKITGYKLLHNHLFADLAGEIFEFGNKDFFEFINETRLNLIERALKKKVEGIIMTLVYIKGKHEPLLRKLIKLVNKNRGTYHFVRLKCTNKELLKRVKLPSRKKYRKLTSQKILNQSLKEGDKNEKIKFVRSYEINNTKIPAKKVSEMIKEHCKLK